MSIVGNYFNLLIVSYWKNIIHCIPMLQPDVSIHSKELVRENVFKHPLKEKSILKIVEKSPLYFGIFLVKTRGS